MKALISKQRQAYQTGIGLYATLLYGVKGTYDSNLAAEKLLEGNHGGNASALKKIEHQGLQHILSVMCQGDTATPIFQSHLEKPPPPGPGALKTSIISCFHSLPVLWRNGFIHHRRNPQFVKVCPNLAGIIFWRPSGKNVRRHQAAVQSMTALQVQQNIQQGKAVRATRDGHQNTFTRLDKPILPNGPMHGFYQVPCRIFHGFLGHEMLRKSKKVIAE